MTKHAYEVSVIIPVHNTNLSMFDKCMASMKAQTCGFENVEWIVVLHNCNAATLQGIHARLDGFSNVRLEELNNEVHSPSSPRNHGLRIARGEYIGFLDADDAYTPECLERASGYLRATGADICHFRRKVELEKEGGLILNELVLWDQTRETIVVNRDTWDGEKLFVSTWAMCTSKLYRRDFLLENDLFFDDAVRFAEDYDFIFGCYGKAKAICLAPQLIGYIYFVNSESLVQTTRITESLLLDYVRGFKKLFDKGEANGIYMNDTISTLLLMVVIWIKSCPQLSPEAMGEIRGMMEPYIRNLKPVRPSKVYAGGRDTRANTLPWRVILGESGSAMTFIDRSEKTMAVTLLDQQRDALRNVLKHGFDSDYARRYDFRNIATVEDYQSGLPVSDQETYRPMIRLTTEIGEQGIFTDDEITAYAISYGPLGVPRRIPFTRDSLQPYVKAFRKEVGSGMTFLMMESLPYTRSRVDMDIKYTNTLMGLILTEYISESLRSFGGYAKFTSPTDLLFPDQIHQNEYIRLLFALRERDVETLYAPNAWILATGLQRLYAQWKLLCDDLEKGEIHSGAEADSPWLLRLRDQFSPDPERAAELRAIFGSDKEPALTRIWPRLVSVIATTSGSFRVYEPYVARHLGTAVLSNSFLANEAACFGSALPGDEGYELDAASAFYEFLPANAPREASPLLVNALKPGEAYEVLVSNLAGLYRYRSGVTLQCERIDDQSVTVRPRCSLHHAPSEMAGLLEEDAFEAVKRCNEFFGTSFFDYSLIRGRKEFILLLEPEDDGEYARLLRTDCSEAERAAHSLLAERSPAFADQSLSISFCEPQAHALYRETQKRRRKVLDDAIAPCHMIDNPTASAFFRTMMASGK